MSNSLHARWGLVRIDQLASWLCIICASSVICGTMCYKLHLRCPSFMTSEDARKLCNFWNVIWLLHLICSFVHTSCVTIYLFFWRFFSLHIIYWFSFKILHVIGIALLDSNFLCFFFNKLWKTHLSKSHRLLIERSFSFDKDGLNNLWYFILCQYSLW